MSVPESCFDPTAVQRDIAPLGIKNPAFPQQVRLVEVGPRDGLQNEPEFIETEDKIRFIQKLAQSGLTHIEATSFVHPRAVPQLADAAEVLEALLPTAPSAVTYSALVPNVKGLERALASGVKEIAVFTAASETFTQRNIQMSIAESLSTFETVVTRARAEGLAVRGYVSTAFVCPYEGVIDAKAVGTVVQALDAMGVGEISIGDTIGAASPAQVTYLLPQLLGVLPVDRLAMHFHNTYGNALANIEASLAHGITIFDTSAGGLGGCPYAPGASGNVATEDVIAFFDQLGIQTGIDLRTVVEASRFMEAVLGRPLPARYLSQLALS